LSIENLITDHLETWTTAHVQKAAGGRGRGKKTNGSNIYGIKKLRELILELAVEGKLVPQDPHDESSSLLLEKIKDERDRLAKQRQIKKPKKLSPISKAEQPFPIPNEWEYVRLNDLGEWGAGSTPSRRRSDYYNGNIPWFKSGELVGDLISSSEEQITELALKETSVRYNKAGDVLIAMYGATIGKTSILALPATTNQAVCACTPFNGFSNVFLLTLLKAYKNRFIDMGAGGAQPNISREKLISTVIALPPTAEQSRIVAKVDELMALCDKLEQGQTNNNETHQLLVKTLLDTLTNATDHEDFIESWQLIEDNFDILFTTPESIDELKQTILQLAVMGKLVPQNPDDETASELLKKIAIEKVRLVKEGKIKKQKPLTEISEDVKAFELPTSWVWTSVSECMALKSGTSFPKEKELDTGEYIYAKVADMNIAENIKEITTSSRFMNPNSKEKGALIPAGSIIFPKRGGAIATNKKRFVSNDIFVDLNIMALTPFKGIILSYAFLWLSGFDLAELNSGTSVPQINNKDIGPLFFPLPPHKEQYRIVSKVDEIMAICDSLQGRLYDAQTTQVHLADAIVGMVD